MTVEDYKILNLEDFQLSPKGVTCMGGEFVGSPTGNCQHFSAKYFQDFLGNLEFDEREIRMYLEIIGGIFGKSKMLFDVYVDVFEMIENKFESDWMVEYTNSVSNNIMVCGRLNLGVSQDYLEENLMDFLEYKGSPNNLSEIRDYIWDEVSVYDLKTKIKRSPISFS